jgi:uncharacterized protein (DUF433 family)
MRLGGYTMAAIFPPVQSDPEVLSGMPVFAGTRVPVRNLLDYLEAGDSLCEFLEEFPSVTRQQAIEVLEYAKETLVAYARTT